MPLIGVPGRRASEANNVRGKAISSGRMYADAIHRAGGLPIVIPPSNDPDVIAATIQRCDGIVMPGGGDVNPTCYGHTENAELRGELNEIKQMLKSQRGGGESPSWFNDILKLLGLN